MKNVAHLTAIALFVATSAATTSGVLASERSSASGKEVGKQRPASHLLEGIWEQRFAYKGKWTGVLKAEVTHVDNSYRMVVLEQIGDGTLIPSLGISNVNHVIDTWTFDSNWGSFGTGNFVLKRQTDDRYVGYAYQDGQQRGVNEWVRIAKPVAGERAIRDDERIKVHESEKSWLIIGKRKSSESTSRQYFEMRSLHTVVSKSVRLNMAQCVWILDTTTQMHWRRQRARPLIAEFKTL